MARTWNIMTSINLQKLALNCCQTWQHNIVAKNGSFVKLPKMAAYSEVAKNGSFVKLPKMAAYSEVAKNGNSYISCQKWHLISCQKWQLISCQKWQLRSCQNWQNLGLPISAKFGV